MATEINNSIMLSSLFSDPVLSAFFERGERDAGMSFAVPAPIAPVFTGGAEANVESARELEYA